VKSAKVRCRPRLHSQPLQPRSLTRTPDPLHGPPQRDPRRVAQSAGSLNLRRVIMETRSRLSDSTESTVRGASDHRLRRIIVRDALKFLRPGAPIAARQVFYGSRKALRMEARRGSIRYSTSVLSPVTTSTCAGMPGTSSIVSPERSTIASSWARSTSTFML